jgi:RNA polymerase sigma-70 factor (ECF subfamily)
VKSVLRATGKDRDEAPTSRVVRLPESEASVVRALKALDPAGAAQLFDRYHGHVQRVLVHVLGPDKELADLVQEVFLAAIDSIDGLREPSALKSWLGTVAVHTARRRLRHRKRRRWLDFFPSDDPPESADPRVPEPEISEAARATYRVLDALSIEDRLVFALRYVDGCELTEIAALCDTSVSTIKRRLARATERFARHARKEASLVDFLEWAKWNR